MLPHVMSPGRECMSYVKRKTLKVTPLTTQPENKSYDFIAQEPHVRLMRPSICTDFSPGAQKLRQGLA